MTDPDELFCEAMALVAAATNAAQRRIAVMALYFAAFHLARLQLSLKPDGAHVHQQLLDAMRRSRDRDVVLAAMRLDSLRRLRTHATYSLRQPFPAALMATAVNHAKAVRKFFGRPADVERVG